VDCASEHEKQKKMFFFLIIMAILKALSGSCSGIAEFSSWMRH